MTEPYLSVVMPVFNEKTTILQIITKVIGLDFVKELVVIEDGSTDGTRQILEQMGSSSKIKLIFHERNLGKGVSLNDGFKVVNGQIIATQDADLEYNPDELKELTTPIITGLTDVVYGSRFYKSKRSGGYFLHMLGNKYLTFLTNLIYRTKLTDMETGYKVFRKEVLKNIVINSNDFSVEPELTAKIIKKGFKIYEVPISYRGRSFSEGKKIKWIHGFSAIWTLIKYRFVK